jgi:hypothetical protein
MAMTTCHECRKAVSTEAHTCPTCGAPVHAQAPAVSLVGRLLGVLGLLGVFGVFGIAVLTTHDQPTIPALATSPTPAPAPVEPPPPVLAANVAPARVRKEFPGYQDGRSYRRNVVVSPGLSLEALTALAKRLHADDPQSIFQIFTSGDEKQFRRMRQWELEVPAFPIPKPDDKMRHPRPSAWMDRHLIAMIARTGSTPGSRFADRWQLTFFNGNAVIPKVREGYTVDLE